MLFNPGAFGFGFSQGFVIGPVTIFGIEEGLNSKKGFWYQMQVILGASLVDFVYLMLSAYGVSQFIDNSIVKLIMWSGASYMLIHMGLNSYHDRPHKMSFKHMHRHRAKILESDFCKGLAINLVNPMAIVFWVMVAGSLYGSYKGVMTPSAFAINVLAGGILSSSIVAVLTVIVKKIFHKKMLNNLVKLGAFVLIGYGLWFFFKAVAEAKPLLDSVLSIGV